MAIEFCSLNSGSNGNCYYIGNKEAAILIDLGISCREVEKRMKSLDIPVEKVKAIFVSHEHSDHIRGIPVFCKKHNVPLYITQATRKHAKMFFKHPYIFSFEEDVPVTIGNLTVTAFRKFHDAADPYSFTVEYKGIRIGVFTDIGRCCEKLISNFRNCHAAFLESNYDEEMLANGSYPYYLKSRITGGLGHLSNREALELFLNHRSAELKHLILSHLSQENNRPELVEHLFKQHANGTEVVVASRYAPTSVFRIEVPQTQEAGFLNQEFENIL